MTRAHPWWLRGDCLQGVMTPRRIEDFRTVIRTNTPASYQHLTLGSENYGASVIPSRDGGPRFCVGLPADGPEVGH